jgi:DNA-binding winged helix-turn-helix (wHTH) protein
MPFGTFQLIPGQRRLLGAGGPLHLGSRALDILTVLIESAGETISNSQIIARVWQTTFVEEASLRVHIGALRKALGDGRAGNRFIANIPGRGYAFVARRCDASKVGSPWHHWQRSRQPAIFRRRLPALLVATTRSRD